MNLAAPVEAVHLSQAPKSRGTENDEQLPYERREQEKERENGHCQRTSPPRAGLGHGFRHCRLLQALGN